MLEVELDVVVVLVVFVCAVVISIRSVVVSPMRHNASIYVCRVIQKEKFIVAIFSIINYENVSLKQI
jgi:hypothetical protein